MSEKKKAILDILKAIGMYLLVLFIFATFALGVARGETAWLTLSMIANGVLGVSAYCYRYKDE